jgi:hypothetical protein
MLIGEFQHILVTKKQQFMSHYEVDAMDARWLKFVHPLDARQFNFVRPTLKFGTAMDSRVLIILESIHKILASGCQNFDAKDDHTIQYNLNALQY